MSAGRITLRVLIAATAALLLQGSSCRVKSNHTFDDEDGNDGGVRTEALLVPPLVDPLGRRVVGPLWVPVPARVDDTGR